MGWPTRNAMWLWLCLSVAAAAFTVGYGIVAGEPEYLVGLLFLGSAAMYSLTIQWMDERDDW